MFLLCTLQFVLRILPNIRRCYIFQVRKLPQLKWEAVYPTFQQCHCSLLFCLVTTATPLRKLRSSEPDREIMAILRLLGWLILGTNGCWKDNNLEEDYHKIVQDTIPFTVQELSSKHDTSKYYLVKNPQIYVSLSFVTLSTKAATGEYKDKRYKSRVHKQPGIRTWMTQRGVEAPVFFNLWQRRE
jgi:hypothetical protein